MHSTLVFLVAILVIGAECRHKGGASSMQYFETGFTAEWTKHNPLKISHSQPNIYGPSYVSPLKALKPAKVVSVSISAPKKYLAALEKHGKLGGFVEPYGPKIGQYGPGPVVAGPKGLLQPQNPPPLNIQRLVNKWGLASMQPLLSPRVQRQLVQPPVQVIQAALTMDPWSIQKGNRQFIILNNQKFPLPLVAWQLQFFQQAVPLVNRQPPAMLDGDLIGAINMNQRAFGYVAAPPRRPKMYQLSNDLYSNELATELPLLLKSQSNKQYSIGMVAPDFKALPPRSRRFRLSTLGTLGYQS